MTRIAKFEDKAGLTDVNFPADTWSAMASRSSLGMAIAAQQAPVGSVAHALHEQNQLTMMLQASLSNMAPIRFGFGGFAQKPYPTYGPVMLGLGNLSPGNQTSETVQQVSKSSDPDLEEIYAALAKQAEGMDVSSPSSLGTYSAKEEITYEGMRKVLGGNGSGTPDGLALYAKSMGPSAKYVFDFFTEDIRTILDPEATAVEKAMAIGFTFFKPAKLLDKAGDVAGAAKDAGKAVEAVDDVKSTGKAVGKGTGNYTGGRTKAELDELAHDPAHAGSTRQIDMDKGKHEARVGLELEEAKKLDGPITRDPSGKAEFFDAKGQAWDVKSFNSNYPPKKGGYKLENAMKSIDKSLEEGENVILDVSNMSKDNKTGLLQEISNRGLKDKVVVWP
ncbi:hypothetical protein [Lysinibacillus sp. 3P01SB]|uniref:hypothetical protein n=1 Tax=Lysinibacillus sp. 3P01SB TaxID=3132284 RepID=UPI0039A4F7C9